MNTLLLLGAGFSRNWGGWLATEAFEYLLGCHEIACNERLRAVLWKHQPSGGFEAALAEVQRDVKRSTNDMELQVLQACIIRMFDAMNNGFAKRPSIEFRQDMLTPVSQFLIRFDAIFTLNQDALLESLYFTDGGFFAVPGNRWESWTIPGMKLVDPKSVRPLAPVGSAIMTPIGLAAADCPRDNQALYKLHGSSNWRDNTNGSLLIMGDNKARDIESHPILRRYAAEFRRRLMQPDTRLMIIGYSFRDAHINEIICEAVGQGLKFFVIDPAGSGLARAVNPHRQPGTIQQDSPIEKTFEKGLIGASRRTLAEIFNTDSVEHGKVIRFFTS